MSAVSEKLDKFFSAYTLRTVKPGEILVHAGEDPPGIIYLEVGRVRKYDISESGAELAVNTFKEGAFFPMSWAINDERNEYFYEAATKCAYRIAPREEVLRFLEANYDVMFDLLARVYRGAEGLTRRMAYMAGGSAHRRALLELYIACRRFGVSSEEGCGITLHEGELAKNAGLSRETFSRELQGLKKAGKVLISRRGLTVTDMAWLEKELEMN